MYSVYAIRANVRPFECARSVLESLFGNSHDKEAPKVWMLFIINIFHVLLEWLISFTG